MRRTMIREVSVPLLDLLGHDDAAGRHVRCWRNPHVLWLPRAFEMRRELKDIENAEKAASKSAEQANGTSEEGRPDGK